MSGISCWSYAHWKTWPFPCSGAMGVTMSDDMWRGYTHFDIVSLNKIFRPGFAWTSNEPHLPYKTGLDVIPLRRMRFGQCQASLAALGWPGDGDCHIMHRMQSGGWTYSNIGRDSSKAPSLRAAVLRVAVLRAAVFCSKILRSDRNHWLLCVISA